MHATHTRIQAVQWVSLAGMILLTAIALMPSLGMVHMPAVLVDLAPQGLVR